MPLRVIADATALISGEGGVARYAAQVTGALGTLGVDVTRFALGRSMVRAPADVRRIRLPLRVLHAWWRVVPRPTIEQLVGDADVLHALDLVPPPTRLPTVVTVHDVAAIERPDLHPRRAVELQHRQVASLDRARLAIADSQATADGLVRLGVDPARIRVALLGLTPLPEPSVVRGAWGGRPFVLAVGPPESRRGFDILLAALQQVPMLDAVFAGRGWGQDPVLAFARRLGVEDRVHVVHRPDDAQLAGLYATARLLCQPSRAEGFGLPVLEALGSGLPIVASSIAVMEELTGSAAVLVAPEDRDALTAAIVRVATDEGLRSRLAAEGKIRAAGYTWEATARATLKAYEDAVA